MTWGVPPSRHEVGHNARNAVNMGIRWTITMWEQLHIKSFELPMILLTASINIFTLFYSRAKRKNHRNCIIAFECLALLSCSFYFHNQCWRSCENWAKSWLNIMQWMKIKSLLIVMQWGQERERAGAWTGSHNNMQRWRNQNSFVRNLFLSWYSSSLILDKGFIYFYIFFVCCYKFISKACRKRAFAKLSYQSLFFVHASSSFPMF